MFGKALFSNGTEVLVDVKDLEEVAQVVANTGFMTDVKVIDINDELLITTSMGFLDYFKDQGNLPNFLNLLLPYQQGQKESRKLDDFIELTKERDPKNEYGLNI